MKIDEIRELMTLLENSKLNVLEISRPDGKIRLEKAGVSGLASMAAVAAPEAPAPAYEYETPAAAQTTSVEAAPATAAPVGKPVKSPMVGVFYTSPAPGEEPFVSVGSRVEKGDVLCIVEAMKLMNEITADTAGEITEVCVADGEIVEFGQPLFYVK